MRGAVTKLPGVSGIEVEPGSADIVVSLDPNATTVEQLLAGMDAAGQSAKRK